MGADEMVVMVPLVGGRELVALFPTDVNNCDDMELLKQFQSAIDAHPINLRKCFDEGSQRDRFPGSLQSFKNSDAWCRDA